MPLIVPANEQGAGFMAAGYARASGKVGVCVVTSGPGATNTVTPVRDCMADSIPIVVICGQVPTAAIGSDAFQEAPVASIMGSVAKHIFLVTDPTKLEATVRTAFEIARTGRPGPVVIDIPKDVQNWRGVFQGVGKSAGRGLPSSHESPHAQRAQPTRSARSFSHSSVRRSGRSSMRAAASFIRARRRRCASSRSSLRFPWSRRSWGSAPFDTTHPLSMRMLGMHGAAFANYAVDDCDFLFALGARFDDRVAGNPPKFAPNAQHIAQIDIDASEINKVKPVHWHHVGLLPEALRALRNYGRRIGFQPRLVARGASIAPKLKQTLRDELRSRERADPAVLRHRRDQQADAGRGDHQHRRRPASDVGRAVLRLSQPAPVADLRQHGHDGFRFAGGDRRADRAIRAASSSTSTAMRASA